MYMNLRLISTSILLFTLVESIPLTADSCQKLQCHPLTEICRRNSSCSNESHPCYSCFRKSHLQRLPSLNSTVDPSFYDDYYEYDEDDHLEDNDEFSGKIDLQDYQDYLEDYVEPFDQGKPIRKLGTCPKVVDALGPCDQANIVQPDCRFDTECPGDLKCCAAACGKRTCTTPVQAPLSNCPQSFQCSLNCRLGYRVDSKGCLLCECQSCPSMEQCQKSCPSGYLKDLFNCDMCECRDQCPPFACRIVCPANVGFAKSETGCPLCQCATSSVASIASNSSCEKDVHCPVGFRCVTDARHVPMCQAVSSDSDVSACSPMKCPTGCDTVIRDVNGCPTCQCRPAQCSRVMCRMYCVHGFKRDAKGCEICACNDSPQPCPPLACEQTCQKYRKDYSGCPTCDCDCPATDCAPTLNCTNGLKTGPDGCPTCSCNEVQEKKPGDSSCPKTRCRMFCMYGFRRNEQGCEMCECDWSPIAENIQCSERIPCPGTRVCNLNLKLCEIVDQDRVNWFLYDFELKSDLLKDQEFMKTFKTGLIHNIAKKYNLKTSQITVSKVEPTGSTSFQIMPYYDENMDDFQDKIDQIDSDLNSHEFRAVLPAIVDVISDNSTPATGSVFDRFRNQWYRYTAGRRRFIVYTFAFLFATAVVLLTVMIAKLLFQKRSYKNLRDSNSPIYDTPYHMAPTDEDHDHSLHSADGAWSINVPGDDLVATSDKRHLVR